MSKLIRKQIDSSSIYVFTNDDFSNLPPRNLFKDRLIQSLAFARRYRYKVGMIAIDLNTFNDDSLMSAVNDDILHMIGGRILKTLRETDTLCSQGVDEFLIILPDIPQDGNEMIVAQKVYELLTQPFTIKSQQVVLSPHIGVTLYPDDAQTPDQIMIQANIAMVEAKTKNVPILHLQKVESHSE